MGIEKIKQWRPNDWKGHELKWKQTAEECYEEGADAMLESLREHSKEMPAYVRFVEELKGTWVFVPDEEKPDEH